MLFKKKSNFVNLFINGCSHTAGSEIEASGIGDSEYNRQACFGAKLANKLGVEYINNAMPGASNDYIFRTTALWIQDNLALAKKSLVLIHWTGAARSEYFHTGTNDPGYWDMIPFAPDQHVGHLHPGYFANIPSKNQWNAKVLSKALFMNELHWQVNRYLNILHLQNLLKAHDIKYVFRNALEMCEIDNRYSYYIDRIDKSQYKYFDDQTQSFFEHCLENGHSIEGQLFHHHKEDAHEYWANKLFTEMF